MGGSEKEGKRKHCLPSVQPDLPYFTNSSIGSRISSRSAASALISSSMIAFCACSRFSACGKTNDRGESITSSVTSSPRCAGKQCRKMASGFAQAKSLALTWYGWKILPRVSASASWPMLVQTSV